MSKMLNRTFYVHIGFPCRLPEGCHIIESRMYTEPESALKYVYDSLSYASFGSDKVHIHVTNPDFVVCVQVLQRMRLIYNAIIVIHEDDYSTGVPAHTSRECRLDIEGDFIEDPFKILSIPFNLYFASVKELRNVFSS